MISYDKIIETKDIQQGLEYLQLRQSTIKCKNVLQMIQNKLKETPSDRNTI